MLRRLIEFIRNGYNNIVLLTEFTIWTTILLVAVGVVVSAIFLGINFWYYPYLFHKDFDMAHTGQFGDYVGGIVGTIFTLITAILLFTTLRVQSEQMILQRQELARTEESIRFQNLENTLYNMIKIHREIYVSINYLHVTL